MSTGRVGRGIQPSPRRITTELLDSGADLTAIVAANDMAAIGALATLRERGISVPDDVSLAGYDDIPFSRDITPPHTTVRVPMVELGRQAMRLALAVGGDEEQVIRLSTEVVIRGSVAKRPKRWEWSASWGRRRRRAHVFRPRAENLGVVGR
jgi:LacI family transcriptional regulator, galactose operon repressor